MAGREFICEHEIRSEPVSLDDNNRFVDKSDLFNRDNTKALHFKRLKTN